MSNADKKILEVKNFSVSFETPKHYSANLRDHFVQALASPVDFLFKSRDRLLVLDNISFDISEGEIVGLIGVNGVGKTTLCRYLAGIIESDKIKGEADVRAIFETNIAFFPNLSGLENAKILIELMYTHLSLSEKKGILEEALGFSELGEFMDMPLNRYSKGMKARLYLSLVTALPARLIILDEIFGSTDHFFSQKLSERIRTLIEKSGAAVVVSHNFEDIENFCNKLIVLNKKKIIFNGDIAKGLEVYQTLRQ